MENYDLKTKAGTIISIHSDRNYGFILGDNGISYFFHRVGVISPAFEDLREGHTVDFLSGKGKKGKPKAFGVVVT